MRLLFFTNAPFVPTGYGNQMQYLVSTLPGMGYEIAVVCNYGLEGKIMPISDRVVLYPGGENNPIRDAAVVYAAQDFNPEVVISLLDVWALKFPSDPEFRWSWVPWMPVDSAPVSEAITKNLSFAAAILAYTRFGQRELAAAGFTDTQFIPHGVDTAMFKPLEDQNEAKKRLNIPENAFCVGFLGRNSFHPSRKGIPEAFLAFARLHKEFPDTFFYVHTMWDQSQAGIHIPRLAYSVGLDKKSVGGPSKLAQKFGATPDQMVSTYNAFDILLAPSYGEGFNIPVMEAMACGTPVVGTRATSHPELIGSGGGWLVNGQPFLHAHGNWWRVPYVDLLHKALRDAYLTWKANPRQWNLRRQAARTNAERYDFKQVVAPMWDRYLRSWPWRKARYYRRRA